MLRCWWSFKCACAAIKSEASFSVYFVCVNSEGSRESAMMPVLTYSFTVRLCFWNDMANCVHLNLNSVILLLSQSDCQKHRFRALAFAKDHFTCDTINWIRVVSPTFPFDPESFRPLSRSPRVVSPPGRFALFPVRPRVVSPTFPCVSESFRLPLIKFYF